MAACGSLEVKVNCVLLIKKKRWQIFSSIFFHTRKNYHVSFIIITRDPFDIADPIVNMTYNVARQESPGGYVVRASDRCTVDSRQGFRFFLCAMFLTY